MVLFFADSFYYLNMFIFLILHLIKIAGCYYNRYINFPVYSSIHNSSVLKQKGESQSRCYKKTKRAKFSNKTHVSYPLIRVRNVRFWENLACIVFLYTRFEIRSFALLLTNCTISSNLPSS